MRRNSSLVLTLFCSGLLLTGIGYLVSKWMDPDLPSGPALARAERISSDVFLLKKHLTKRKKLDKRSAVRALETIETGPLGEALLEFPNDFRLSILGNSQVTLDTEGDKTVAIVKTGDVRVENYGREGSLFISKNGHRWSATEYGGEPPTKEPLLVSKGTVMESLSPSYVMETLKAHKGNFYKCYTHLLQRLPGMTGDASISITIEPNGKISRSDVVSSRLEDPHFKKCLMEATHRIEFKAFAGDSITTVFPIKFE